MDLPLALAMCAFLIRRPQCHSLRPDSGTSQEGREAKREIERERERERDRERERERERQRGRERKKERKQTKTQINDKQSARIRHL